MLVYGMGCSYTGCGVSIQDGELKNRTGYELSVYRMGC